MLGGLARRLPHSPRSTDRRYAERQAWPTTAMESAHGAVQGGVAGAFLLQDWPAGAAIANRPAASNVIIEVCVFICCWRILRVYGAR
jgi:hypothetical protein